MAQWRNLASGVTRSSNRSIEAKCCSIRVAADGRGKLTAGDRSRIGGRLHSPIVAAKCAIEIAKVRAISDGPRCERMPIVCLSMMAHKNKHSHTQLTSFGILSEMKPEPSMCIVYVQWQYCPAIISSSKSTQLNVVFDRNTERVWLRFNGDANVPIRWRAILTIGRWWRRNDFAALI